MLYFIQENVLHNISDTKLLQYNNNNIAENICIFWLMTISFVADLYLDVSNRNSMKKNETNVASSIHKHIQNTNRLRAICHWNKNCINCSHTWCVSSQNSILVYFLISYIFTDTINVYISQEIDFRCMFAQLNNLLAVTIMTLIRWDYNSILFTNFEINTKSEQKYAPLHWFLLRRNKIIFGDYVAQV